MRQKLGVRSFLTEAEILASDECTFRVAAVQRCTYVTCGEVPETVQKQQLEVVRCLLEEYKVELRPAGLYGERGLIYETEHMT